MVLSWRVRAQQQIQRLLLYERPDCVVLASGGFNSTKNCPAARAVAIYDAGMADGEVSAISLRLAMVAEQQMNCGFEP